MSTRINKPSIEDCKDGLIEEFKSVIAILSHGGRIHLDSNQIRDFINIVFSLEHDSGYSFGDFKEIEKVVWSIPREILIIDDDGGESIENDEVFAAIERVRRHIIALKVQNLLNYH